MNPLAIPAPCVRRGSYSSMTFFPMGPVALFVRGGLVGRTDRQQSRSRFFRSPSCQKQRPGLGKFEWETVYHGDHAFFRRRSCQNRRIPWGNSQRNPSIMAIPQEKAGIAPKLAIRGCFGEIPMRTCLSWRFPQEKAALTPKPATFDPLGKIRFGTRLSLRSRNQARSDWANHLDWRNKKG